MQSVGELAAVALGRLGSVDHVQAEPGDYIGDDGLLHCGCLLYTSDAADD